MVYSNVVDTITGNRQMDMTEFTKYSLYGGTKIKFLTPQLQVPLPHYGDERYLEKLTKSHLSDSTHYVNFTEHSKLDSQRLPVRHTFMLKGGKALIQSIENPRVFKEQFDSSIVLNTKFERGMYSYVLPESHYLPIPFPRFLKRTLVTQEGLLAHVQEDIPDELRKEGLTMPKMQMPEHFHHQLPTLTKLCLDGSYLGTVENCLRSCKNLTKKTRLQLLKEQDMEEDDWFERIGNLRELVESYKAIALSDEPDDDENESDDDY